LIWDLEPANGHEYRLTTGYYWGSAIQTTRTRPDWFDAEDEAGCVRWTPRDHNDEAEKNWLVHCLFCDPVLDGWGARSGSALRLRLRGIVHWISGETPVYQLGRRPARQRARTWRRFRTYEPTSAASGSGMTWAPTATRHTTEPVHGIIERSQLPPTLGAGHAPTMIQALVRENSRAISSSERGILIA